MSTLNLIFLIVQTLVFIVWAGLMFSMLWRISRKTGRNAEKTGSGYFNWAGHSLRNHLEFLFGSGTNSERSRLIFWTVLLVGSIIVNAVLFAP